MSSPPQIPERSSSLHPRLTGILPESITLTPSSLSIQSEREIENLYNIADNRWHWKSASHREKVLTSNKIIHNAEAITRLMITSSLVIRDPSSARIKRFVERYRQHEALDIRNISHDDLESLIHEYFLRFDELFFFGLMNREIDGEQGRRKLVIMKAYNFPNPKDDGNFNPNEDTLEIWMRCNETCTAPSVTYLVCVLLHEMVHAFLDIFADEEDNKYHEQVSDHGGHGVLFWVMLKFVLGRIFEFTGSEYIWNEMLNEENHRVECARKPRYKLFFERIFNR
ncbi:hypothetical protein F5Y10DRAFT_289407 [Nemania abortiva]|nr:hypothetical protein F5Y10DRAFT_289407 [Nemania abortiva]